MKNLSKEFWVTLSFSVLVLVLVSAKTYINISKQTAAVADFNSSLVAHYTFDDGTATDSSSSGNNGTVSGATATAGKVGSGALAFDIDQNVTVPSTASLEGFNDFTISAWFNLASNGTPYANILSKNTQGSGEYTANLYAANSNSGYSYLWLNNSATAMNSVSPDGGWQLNKWYHVTFSRSGNTITQYINGVSAGTNTFGTKLSTSGLPLIIGNAAGSPYPIKGAIDDVRIYNTALSSSQVAELYALGGSTVTPPNNPPPDTNPPPVGATTFSLTISKTGSGTVSGGTISCGATCSQSSITSGTSITLTATPSAGFAFSGWSGGGCSGTDPCTVNVTANTTVLAPFIAVSNGVPATPEAIGAKGVSGDQVNISWAPSIGGTTPTAKYNIYRNDQLIGSLKFLTDNEIWKDPSIYQDVGLSPNTTYKYTVKAVSPSGVESPPTTAVNATTQSSSSGIIPANRLTNWTPGVTVGVPGGLKTRTKLVDVTAAPYNADKTGANDMSVALNAAINAAQPEDVIYFPTGIYRLTNPIYIQKSNITIRGAGQDAVVINCEVSSTCIVYRGQDFYNLPTSAVTSGVSNGSNQITVADGASYQVGGMVNIFTKNDYSLPVFSPYGYEGMKRQMSIITGKSGSTITISPPLIGNYLPGKTTVTYVQTPLKFVGVEDLTIKSTVQSQVGIGMGSTYGSWIKNVRVKGIKNYVMSVWDSLYGEIRHSFLDEGKSGGSNGAGLLMGNATGFLVEDNIINKSFPGIEVNSGSTGNVFAYNYFIGNSVDSNHAAHNSYNLYEGNIMDFFMSDGYYGSESEATIFRNWNKSAIALKRFSRNFSIVGNQIGDSGTPGQYSFGQPNIGNGASTGFAAPSGGYYWADWNAQGPTIKGTLTSRSSASEGEITITTPAGDARLIEYCRFFGNGYCLALGVEWSTGIRRVMSQSSRSGNVIGISGGYDDPLPSVGTTVGIWPRSEGFQERDLDVGATTILKGNWYSGTSGGYREVNESLNGQTLPNSLYLSSKPAWFGTLAWPPFSPTTRNFNEDTLPAGYRFNHPTQEAPGVSGTYVPPPVPVADTTKPTVSLTTPTGGTLTGAVTITASATDNVGVVGVQFKLNGNNLGTEVTTAPFSIQWNTQTSTNGTYTLTATARDLAGNTTVSSAVTVNILNVLGDVIAPTTPPNLVATLNQGTSVSLAWGVSTDNTAVTGYKIYRNGVELTTTANTTYTDTNLTPNTTYSYTVAAYDGAGNLSGQSISKSITTPQVADTIAPSITNLNTTTVAPTSVTISWITDELSSTQVSYGTTNALGLSTILETVLTLNHTVSLVGLSPSTTYYYSVRSTDGAGNLKTSTIQTVTTGAPVAVDTTPPTISNLSVGTITGSSARVNLTTNEVSISKVMYGTSPTTLTSIAANTDLVTSHSIKLENLSRGTTYYYKVEVTDAGGNTTPSTIQSFTTGSRLDTPPSVTNLKITYSPLTLSWTPPTYEYLSQVIIQRGYKSYPRSTSDGTNIATLPKTSNTFTDSNIELNTVYYYSVFTTDDQGNISAPSYIAFKPAKPTNPIPNLLPTTVPLTTNTPKVTLVPTRVVNTSQPRTNNTLKFTKPTDTNQGDIAIPGTVDAPTFTQTDYVEAVKEVVTGFFKNLYERILRGVRKMGILGA